MVKIYIAIASYRDQFLQSTIDDAFAKAAYSDSLSVGCFIQVLDNDPNFYEHLITNDYGGRVRYKVAPAGNIFSVSKCRNLALKWLTSEHDYVLQIDSHTRFEKDWDKTLLTELSKTANDKAILSCYPPQWFPKRGWDIYVNWSFTHWPMCSYNTEEAKKAFMATYDLVPTLLDIPRSDTLPAKSWYMSGAFIFAPAEYYLTVKQPDWIAFWGEELFQSLVTFTNGWDVYAPYNRPIYSVYPQDINKDEIKLNKIWEDFPENWGASHRKGAKHLVKSIIDKTTGVGYFGTARPVEELYEFLGYNLGEILQKWSDEYEALHKVVPHNAERTTP